MRKPNPIERFLITATMLIGLVACGHDTGERALSGGAIGAGVGAVGTVMTGGCVACGAVVGGAVGAGVGALTNDKQIDLGK